VSGFPQRSEGTSFVTLIDSLEAAAKKLAAIHDTGRLDAEVLLAFVLEKPRHYAYAFSEHSLSVAQADTFRNLVARRAAGEPIAYITGEREFWSMSLQVTSDTLIPRPETERLVELALQVIPTGGQVRIADLGTGTGAIALALAHEREQCTIVATDFNESILEVARNNALRHGISNVEFRLGSWFEPIYGDSFELIVCNPPYVRADDSHLNQGDVRFEPRTALIGGSDGLDDIRRICEGAKHCLVPNGHLLIEHGARQKKAVRSLMVANGYNDIDQFQDYAQLDRITQGRPTAK